MAQTLTLFPNPSRPAQWDRGYGGYRSAWDQQPLNYPRSPSGDAVVTGWSPIPGSYTLPDGSLLSQPRTIASAPNGYGQPGSVPSSYGLVPGSYMNPGTVTGSSGAPPVGSASGGGFNPITTLRNPKSAAVDTQVGGLLDSYGTMRKSGGGAVQGFLDRLHESQGTQASNFNRDLGIINARQSGDVLRNQIASVQSETPLVQAQMAQNAALIAGRTNASQILRTGGSGSTLRAEEAQQLREQQIPWALRNAELTRNYTDTNTAAARADVGAATNLQDTWDRRLLIPLEEQRRQLGLDTAALAPISGIDLQNTAYSYSVPQPFASSVTGLPTGYGGGLPMPPTGYGPTSGTPGRGGTNPYLLPKGFDPYTPDYRAPISGAPGTGNWAADQAAAMARLREEAVANASALGNYYNNKPYVQPDPNWQDGVYYGGG